MVKKYDGSAWVDVNNLKRYQDDAWGKVSFANKYNEETQAWEKVYPNNFKIENVHTNNNFQLNLSKTLLTFNAPRTSGTNKGEGCTFYIYGLEELREITLRFYINANFGGEYPYASDFQISSHMNLGGGSSGVRSLAYYSSSVSGYVEIHDTVVGSQAYKDIYFTIGALNKTVSGTISDMTINGIPVYFTD